MAMTILRDYQKRFIAEIRNKLAEKRRVIACAATGSGKSKVFIAISKQAIEKQRTVLIVTESTKIYKQIKEEIKDCIHIAEGVKHVYLLPNTIYIAMAQTLVRRPFIISQFQDLKNRLLIITDEAHVGTSTKLLLQLQEAYHVGFTATPDFRKAKNLPLLYDDIVIGSQPQDLVNAGFLSPYNHYERRIANLGNLQKDNKGEYSESSQLIVFEDNKVFDGISEDLAKFQYNACLIFCSSIKHCQDLSEKLSHIDHVQVHSQHPQSDFNLFLFTSGKVKVCISVGILTKGFDFPAIDLVCLVRATTSLPLYLQMCGRGSRIFEGKKDFTILDYGGNCSRLGLWNYDHDWATMWNGKNKKKKEGIAPVKTCPKCEYMMAVSVNLCPNCGYVFKQKTKELAVGELVNVTEEFNNLRGKHIADLSAKELAKYAKITNKKGFAIRVARGLEQENNNGFLNDFRVEMGYRESWLHHQKTDEKINFYNIKIK